MSLKAVGRALAFVAAFCLALTFSGVALADDPSTSATPTPAALVESGTVAVDIVIKNTSNTVTMEDPTLEGPQINPYNVGNIGPGETRQLQIPSFNITSDQLGKAINLKLSWVESGNRLEKTIPFTVSNRQASPKLQATRKVDKELVEEGAAVTLSYVLQNQGDVDITNIEINDPAFSEPVATKLSLAVGDAAKTITKQLTMGAQPVTSQPTVKYSAAGQSGEIKIDPIEIKVARVALDAVIQIKESNAAGTTLTIVLTNTGNVGLTKLKVSDELGNEIKAGIDLAPEKSDSIEYTVTGTVKRFFLVNVTGTDALKRPFTYDSTKSVEIKPFIDSSSVQLGLTADVDDSMLATTGRVKVTFKISNEGDVVLHDAVIHEETLGDVVTIGVLNTGETTKVESFDIKGDTQLRFSLKAVDSADTAYSANAKTLDITLPKAEPTPSPEPDETPAPEEEGAASPVQGTLLTLIIVIAVLLIAAVIALVVLLMQDKKNKASQTGELDELEELLEKPKLRATQTADNDDFEDIDMPWGSDDEAKPQKESRFRLPRGPARPSQGLPDKLAPSRGASGQAPRGKEQKRAPEPPARQAAPAAAPQPKPRPPVTRQPERITVQQPAPPVAPPASQVAPPAAPPAQQPVPPRMQQPAIPPVPPPYMPPPSSQPLYQAPIQLEDIDSGWDELDDEL